MPGVATNWAQGGIDWFGQLKGDPDFQKLSPQSQQILLQYASQAKSGLGPQQLEAAIKSDPALQGALAEAKDKGALDHPITPFMKALMVGVAAVGTAGVLSSAGLLGGAAAGGGGAATAPSALPAGVGIGETAATTGLGGAVAPIVKNAVTGSSLLHDLLPSIIGGGAAVGGAAIAAHANTEAAKIAAEQADKALAIQQQQYALQRQDTAPYRALGQGAVGNLGFLSGINMPQENIDALSSTVPKTTPPPIPTASTPPTYNSPQSLATLGAPQQPQAPANNGGLVPMKNPDTGLVHLIPPDQVAAATQSGGVRV